MKTALAVLALFLACLLAGSSSAQSTSHFQSVGGEYGQTWISNYKAANPQPADQSTQQSGNNDLWSWGSAPKGSIIVDGKLQADPYYYWKSLNLSNSWLEDAYVDPFTGNRVYSYVDPSTGITRYFYMDPITGKPVYVEYNPAALTYGSALPFYTTSQQSQSYALPSIFS